MTFSGRWTHRLVPNIETWVNRNHGEVDYYITQFITWHGCFRAYQYRFKLDETGECPLCPGMEESAEPVFFFCHRFHEDRREFQRVCGSDPTADNIVNIMLLNQDYWMAGQQFAKQVMQKLRNEEKDRRTRI
ncbi:uncharacterized protein [Halyomorpha halys]|uniref:uncharacterized protein n=1 Tax=Halyomorpha halys TaxID=286706 RepID=UPI0034D364BA